MGIVNKGNRNLFAPYKAPKKVKGARKKERQYYIDMLTAEYPTWFEGKSETEIKQIAVAYKNSSHANDLSYFPAWLIEYEAAQQTLNIDSSLVNLSEYYKSDENIN